MIFIYFSGNVFRELPRLKLIALHIFVGEQQFVATLVKRLRQAAQASTPPPLPHRATPLLWSCNCMVLNPPPPPCAICRIVLWPKDACGLLGLIELDQSQPGPAPAERLSESIAQERRESTPGGKGALPVKLQPRGDKSEPEPTLTVD